MRKTVHSASFPGWAICAYLSGSPGLHSERNGVTALEVAGLPQTTLGTSLLSLILMGPDLRNTRFGTTAVGKRPPLILQFVALRRDQSWYSPAIRGDATGERLPRPLFAHQHNV